MRPTFALPLATASLSVALLAPALSPAATPLLSIANLRCEYKVDPIGIDVARPRLSWQLRSAARGVAQSAYQAQVTRDGKLLWDTGKVASDRSVHVPYEGPALESSRRYTWRVRVWDGGGKASAWSAPAFWETGLLSPADWKARWIESAQDAGAKASQPAPMLRGTFTVNGRVKSARAYVTSLGLYELEINGRRVGDQLLTPGWTSYKKRLQYQTYDVTSLPARGRERDRGDRSATAGTAATLAWRDTGAPSTATGRACSASCGSSYEDGRVETAGTDGTWKSATGPIRARTSTTGRPTTRGRSGRAGARRDTTTATGRPCASPSRRPAPSIAHRRPAGAQDRGATAADGLTEPGAARRLRPRAEHGRLGAADGARRPRARRSPCATPRCSTRRATSTPTNLRGARGRPMQYTLKGGSRGGLRAALHLPRLPLRRR